MDVRTDDWIRWDFGNGRASKWHKVFRVSDSGVPHVYCGKGDGQPVIDVWSDSDPDDEHGNCHLCRRAEEMENRAKEALAKLR